MLRLRAFQPYHQILYILKHVGDVGDRSSTPKGCNAIYVGDIRDHNNHQILCILKIITISDIPGTLFELQCRL